MPSSESNQPLEPESLKPPLAKRRRLYTPSPTEIRTLLRQMPSRPAIVEELKKQWQETPPTNAERNAAGFYQAPLEPSVKLLQQLEAVVDNRQPMADTVTQEQPNAKPTLRDGLSRTYAETLQRCARPRRHVQRVPFRSDRDLATLLDFGFNKARVRVVLHLNSSLTEHFTSVLLASAHEALSRGLKTLQILIGPNVGKDQRESLEILRQLDGASLKASQNKKAPNYGAFDRNAHWVTTDPSDFLDIPPRESRGFFRSLFYKGTAKEVSCFRGTGGVVSFGDANATDDLLGRFDFAWDRASRESGADTNSPLRDDASKPKAPH